MLEIASPLLGLTNGNVEDFVDKHEKGSNPLGLKINQNGIKVSFRFKNRIDENTTRRTAYFYGGGDGLIEMAEVASELALKQTNPLGISIKIPTIESIEGKVIIKETPNSIPILDEIKEKVQEAKAIIDFISNRENITNLIDSVSKELGDFVDTIDDGTVEGAYLRGKVTVEILSLFVGVGEAKAAVKGRSALTRILSKIKNFKSKVSNLKVFVKNGVQEIRDKTGNLIARGNDSVKALLRKTKSFSVQNFDDYIANIKTRNPAGSPDAPFRKYQEKVAGSTEYELVSGNSKIWADGVERSTGKVLEAKFVSNPSKSPFIDSSSAPQFIKDKVRNEVRGEFQRYSDIIKNSDTPMTQLEVITNNTEATRFFEGLMREFKIPGKVVIKQ